MRRGATGCARVVSRRANAAAVSSQFGKPSSGDSALFITWYSFSSAAVKMEEELYLLLNLALYLRRRRRRRHRRSVWVRSIFRRRRQQGEFHNLLQEMRLSDSESHFRYLRMTKERFDFLLSKVLGKAVYFWT